MPHFKTFVGPVTIIALGWTCFAHAAGEASSSTQTSTQPSAQDQAKTPQIACMRNLQIIGQGIIAYASDHQGRFPPDLGTLIGDQGIGMNYFICPASRSVLPDQWQKMTPAQQATWVNLHTDYVYLGAKMNIRTPHAAETPLAYDKDDDHGGTGMNVLFLDLHVEFLSLDEVHRRFGPQAGTQRDTTRVEADPSLEEARKIKAVADLSSLKTAINMFDIDNDRFPTTQEGLTALFVNPGGLPRWQKDLDVDHLPLDPWGHPYVYLCPGSDKNDFDVYSKGGADGKRITSDGSTAP